MNTKNKYYGDPDYKGSQDEIVRLSIERKFERSIPVNKCHGVKPRYYFTSTTQYQACCPICGRHTGWQRKLYKAMQTWNRITVDIERA